jgi:hypothetical protein
MTGKKSNFPNTVLFYRERLLFEKIDVEER